LGGDGVEFARRGLLAPSQLVELLAPGLLIDNGGFRGILGHGVLLSKRFPCRHGRAQKVIGSADASGKIAAVTGMLENKVVIVAGLGGISVDGGVTFRP
jgi:hypothetical protein